MPYVVSQPVLGNVVAPKGTPVSPVFEVKTFIPLTANSGGGGSPSAFNRGLN